MSLKELIKRRQTKVGTAVCLMCTGFLCFSVFAEGPSTNVWIDVVEESTEARISVTVPASYGFVVKGSTALADSNPVSVSDGNLLLSNYRVTVSSPSATLGSGSSPGNSVYQLEMVGSGAAVPVRNYSTDVREENLNLTNPPREGLPVSIRPHLVEETDTKYWQAVGTEPASVSTDFKKYQMVLAGQPLSEAVQIVIDGVAYDAFRTVSDIDLAAPPDVPTYGYTAAGTAIIPSETYLSVDVKVGGVQNQYKQVEQSAKVGTIYWKIIPGELPDTTP
ncbi:MAG: hypothetical protein ACRDBO_16880 [Lachnospiraceae bacterium]